MEEMMEQEPQNQAGEFQDLSGIRGELEEIWAKLDELNEAPVFSGALPGESGDGVPDEDLMPYEVRLRQAREAGDMLMALRVKQEAAGAGLVLL